MTQVICGWSCGHEVAAAVLGEYCHSTVLYTVHACTVSHAFAASVSIHGESLGGVMKTPGKGSYAVPASMYADKAPDMQSLYEHMQQIDCSCAAGLQSHNTAPLCRAGGCFILSRHQLCSLRLIAVIGCYSSCFQDMWLPNCIQTDCNRVDLTHPDTLA